MSKNRHIKTVYDRFSHHKVEDLKSLKEEVRIKLSEYFESQEQKHNRHGIEPNYDIFKALHQLNISYSGKFYISNHRDDNKPWSDVDKFYQAFEKCVPDVQLEGRTDKLIEVHVIAADFKDAVLLIYKDRSSYRYNMHIVRDKHSELLLEGNIAHYMSN